MDKDIKTAKKTLSEFLNSFGSSNDIYTQVFLETFFEELFNGNALPLFGSKKQEGTESYSDILWKECKMSNKNSN